MSFFSRGLIQPPSNSPEAGRVRPAPWIDLLLKSILPGEKNAQLIVFQNATALESFKTNVMFSASAQKAAFTKRKRRGAGPRALLRGGGG